MQRSFWSRFGPGLITGASDDDPSGIATYAQAGAQFGFASLWLALFTTPLMIVVQETCARIAIASKSGLFALFRKYMPAWLAWGLALMLIVANVFNIAADLNMMAASVQSLFPLSRWMWLVVFAVGSLLLQILLRYVTYEKFLRWLVFSLLAYVIVLFFVHVPWAEAIRATLIPQQVPGKDFLLMIIAILGTTLSPYLYVWQASEEVEEEEEVVRENAHKLTTADRTKLLTNIRSDVRLGMIISNVIFWCLVTAAAATLHAKGITLISSADQMAVILQPLVGSVASVLFTLGIIGTGLLTIPVLAGSAAYAIAELKRWRCSLNDSYREATKFYSVIAVFMLIGLLLNILNIPPIQMLIWSATMNAILAPPLLLAIIWVANHKKIMHSYRVGRWMNLGLMISFLVMTIATVVWGVVTYLG